MVHLGVMVASSNKEAILWFNQLQDGEKGVDWIEADQQTYWYKEFSGLFALGSALKLLRIFCKRFVK